jgi:hypothetical protein
MTSARFLAPLAFLAVGSAPALAVDLAKIDRGIAMEPACRFQPQYCLLVFGPRAEFRVWLVRDGNVLYVDRNGNGDLTEAGKRIPAKTEGSAPVFDVGDITEGDGRTKHAKLLLQFHDTWTSVWLLVNGRQPRMASLGAQSLQFAARPQDAPVLHFSGPLTIRLAQIAKVGAGAVFVAEIGTPGLGGSGSFAAIDVQHPGLIPKDVAMFAEIEYASKDPAARPIKARLSLACREH